MNSKDIRSKNKSELQLIAKQEGLKGYSKLKKDDLIALLSEYFSSQNTRSENTTDPSLPSTGYDNETISSEKPKRDYRLIFSWLGGYLVGAWTLLQFVDWILGRYSISPYWTDILLWLFIGILPTFLIYLFNMERINRFAFRRWEMLIIPANIITVLGAIFFMFRGADLGATTTQFTYINTEGIEETKEVVKEEFKKQIPIFPFEFIGPDTSSTIRDHTLILHQFIDYDLDLYADISGTAINLPRNRIGVEPYTTSEKIANSKILQSDIYIDGTTSFNGSDEKFNLTLNIRNKDNGALKEQRTLTGVDLFDIADKVSQVLPEVIGITKKQSDEKINISVKEVATDNLEAARHYSIAMTKGPFASNIDKAIELDSTYAIAYLARIQNLINYSGGSLEAKEMVDAAMKYRKRLPPNLQVVVMIFKHWIYEEWDKAEALLQMHLEQDAQNEDYNLLLWLLYINTDQTEKLITLSSRIFKMNPTSPMSSFMLGMANLINAQPEKLIRPLKRILLIDPQNLDLLSFLITAYMNAGKYDEAQSTLDKIVLIEPDQEKLAQEMYQAIAYIKSHSNYENEIRKWVGDYRETSDEQILHISIKSDHLFTRATNQPGGFAYVSSDSTIYSYYSGTCHQYKAYFEKGELTKIKTTQSSTDHDNFSYYYVAQDSIAQEAQRMIQNQNYAEAALLLDRSIQKYPEQVYLPLMKKHVDYMFEMDHAILNSQYIQISGNYSGMVNEEASTAELWIEKGVLYYKRPGLARRILRPIGDNRFMNLNRYDSIYEIKIVGQQMVRLNVYTFDHATKDYVIADDWEFEKKILKG